MAQLVWGDRKGEHFPALPYHLLPEAMVAIDKHGKTDIAIRSCLKGNNSQRGEAAFSG